MPEYWLSLPARADKLPGSGVKLWAYGAWRPRTLHAVTYATAPQGQAQHTVHLAFMNKKAAEKQNTGSSVPDCMLLLVLFLH